MKENREKTGYADNSSINNKKTSFNMFDSCMQTLQSQQWYSKAAPCRETDIITLRLPRIPLSRFCQNRYTPAAQQSVSAETL